MTFSFTPEKQVERAYRCGGSEDKRSPGGICGEDFGENSAKNGREKWAIAMKSIAVALRLKPVDKSRRFCLGKFVQQARDPCPRSYLDTQLLQAGC